MLKTDNRQKQTPSRPIHRKKYCEKAHEVNDSQANVACRFLTSGRGKNADQRAGSFKNFDDHVRTELATTNGVSGVRTRKTFMPTKQKKETLLE